MLRDMAAETAAFSAGFHDDPAIYSRWGHQYFCNDDGARLVFDPEAPHTHRCSLCGKEYHGDAYDGAWVCHFRNHAILQAWKAATCYRADGSEQQLEIALGILDFYSRNYLSFGLHNKEHVTAETIDGMPWGCGRIMPQVLNEAIIAVRIVQTLELLRDAARAQPTLQSCEAMLREMVILLRPQVVAVHNISFWSLCAIGVIACYLGDTQAQDFIHQCEYNMDRQLREGVTADGFWYEGSMHYNFFLLEGVVTYLLFARLYDKPYALGEETVSRMLTAAYHNAFDSGRFPTPNDGWPDINLKTYSYVYHIAARAMGGEMVTLLRAVENSESPRMTLPLSESYYWRNSIPLERLLLNTDLDLRQDEPVRRLSASFPAANFAMLRQGKLNAFLKYGLNGRSHAHPDIMNIELMYGDRCISRDLSNAGYQSTMCNTWHRKTMAHNTVICGGQDITATHPGRSIHFAQDEIEAECGDVYPGISYRRRLALTSDTVQDAFSVTSQAATTMDYVFHLERGAELDAAVDMMPASLGYAENGYQYAQDVQRITGQGSEAALAFRAGSLRLRIGIDLSGGKQLYLARTPDNPVSESRTTLIVRAEGEKSARFMTTIDIKEG